ncbi:MAG: TetR/AcrR family transcriptional regulator [Pseudomonadota bacterium]
MSGRTEVRERILDAAAEILESRGLKQLNTNSLASAAGVTPPTIYRHFENKEAVVAALADRFIEAERDWLKQATVILSSDATVAEIIDALIDAYWRAAKEQRGIVALRGAMRVWPELQTAEETSLANSTTLVAEVLRAHWKTTEPKELTRVARHIVETVCATVDRCYPLKPREQRWRIEELKASVASYAVTRLEAS